jgi:hypothetical protein
MVGTTLGRVGLSVVFTLKQVRDKTVFHLNGCIGFTSLHRLMTCWREGGEAGKSERY